MVLLQNASTTARTLTSQQRDLDAALLAATWGAGTGEDVLLEAAVSARAVADLVPTATLLDTYSPEPFCMIRNFHDVAPKVAGRGAARLNSPAGPPERFWEHPTPMSIRQSAGRMPTVDPADRAAGRRSPGSCGLAPHLVMDTGASLRTVPTTSSSAKLMFTEYVWGRQYGENTINP